MRVIFVIEDSLPNRRVGPELTPTLWSLIQQGGWHPGGGVSVLASSTYPNHATFATGVDVVDHRIFTNDTWDGERFICAAEVGPRGDTLFNAARRANVSTAAITGAFTMVGCMGADQASIHWPKEPVAESVARDVLGYAANEAVLEVLSSTGALETDLIFVHMNDPDSTLHHFGPEATEATDAIRRVDQDLALIVDLLMPQWADTVLFVVSDHEQEAVDRRFAPIDLAAELDAAGLPGRAHNEGSVGIIYESAGAEEVRSLKLIEDAIDLDTGITLAWSGTGRVFGGNESSTAGQHGSPRTRTQVATVTGGHPIVPSLARSLESGFGSPDGRPHATHYANVISELLAIPLGADTQVP